MNGGSHTWDIVGHESESIGVGLRILVALGCGLRTRGLACMERTTFGEPESARRVGGELADRSRGAGDWWECDRPIALCINQFKQ